MPTEITTEKILEDPNKDLDIYQTVLTQTTELERAYYNGLISGLISGSCERKYLPSVDTYNDITFDLQKFAAVFSDINAEGLTLTYRLWEVYHTSPFHSWTEYQIQIWDENDNDEAPEDNLPLLG